MTDPKSVTCPACHARPGQRCNDHHGKSRKREIVHPQRARRAIAQDARAAA